jgi:arylsulfatase
MRDDQSGSTRRELLKGVSLGAAAAALGPELTGSPLLAAASAAATAPQAAPSGPYNILFILTDQERYFRPGELPPGYRLPARERLARQGVVFENHRINSCVCTPSRSVLYTGQHIQQTRMFDNTNFPWISSMSTEIPTVGDLLRDAGYYTAYRGKWHLTKEFETVNTLAAPEKIFTKEMEAYGFADYLGIGDIIGHTQGGYLHDGMIAASAINWLRGRAAELAAQSKPWFFAVNLVNPHDIMFYNTDRPGEQVQEAGAMTHVARAPNQELYAKRWPFAFPASFAQSLTAPGRPAAHKDYMRVNDAMVGRVPEADEWRWRSRNDYYLNCLSEVDGHIGKVLDELDASGLTSSTIVILTSDHGEFGGAHRLIGKGGTSYREQNNVPLIVSHPAFAGGKRCKAVTSHLDIAPTLVSLTNASAEKKAAITKKLPGRDFSKVLAAPEVASHDAVRDGQLFCFNMFLTVDGDFAEQASQLLRQPGGKEKFKLSGLKPNLMKRGAIRSVFDGRYQFSRYFSNKQHNRPTSIEALLKLNDVELFDLQADPNEMDNLAMSPARNADLLLAMNAKLNRLVDAEVGEDVGQMLPGGVDAGWVATPAVNDI